MRHFIAILAALAGFAGGWYFSPAKHAPGSEDANAQALADLTSRPARQEQGPGRSSPVAPVISEQLEEAFSSARVGYTEMRALMQALSLLSSENVSEFAEFFRDRRLENPQIALWQMVFSAWGEFDPDGAVAFIDRRFESASARRLFYAAVIDTWKNDSIERVLEFALQKFQSEDEGDRGVDSHLALEYLRSLAETDPDRALAFAMKLGDGEFVLELTARRISELAEQDRNSALEAIETLTGEAHLHAASQYVIDWAKMEPAAAADWLVTHFDERFGVHALGQVAKSYVRSDPGAAIRWIDGLPDEQSRAVILAEAVREWAQIDPVAAAVWLKDSGANSEHDLAVIALSNHISIENPREVIEEWIPRITDPQMGSELLSDVSLEWERSNPAEYSQWLEQTEALSNEVKQRLLAREFPGSAGGDARATGTQDSLPAPPVLDQGRDR